MTQTIRLPTGKGSKRDNELSEFASQLESLQNAVDFKQSARGWCYTLEGLHVIDKGEFDKAERIINECRKKGYLDIDFTASDSHRQFHGVETPTSSTPIAYFKSLLERVVGGIYTPYWWKGEDYYIQMLVEKADLVGLFRPICKEYHIPIANSVGWADINIRAEMAQRYSDMEEKGCKPVLKVFGDFDPWGMSITSNYSKLFEDIAGGTSWYPDNLIVDRFGLSIEQINQYHLLWIDNLTSGSGNDMTRLNSSIVHDYVAQYGMRKCEANAVMPHATAFRRICRQTIEDTLGRDALSRFAEKTTMVDDILTSFKERVGINEALEQTLAYEETAEDLEEARDVMDSDE